LLRGWPGFAERTRVWLQPGGFGRQEPGGSWCLSHACMLRLGRCSHTSQKTQSVPGLPVYRRAQGAPGGRVSERLAAHQAARVTQTPATAHHRVRLRRRMQSAGVQPPRWARARLVPLRAPGHLADGRHGLLQPRTAPSGFQANQTHTQHNHQPPGAAHDRAACAWAPARKPAITLTCTTQQSASRGSARLRGLRAGSGQGARRHADFNALREADVAQQYALVQLHGRHVHLHVRRHRVAGAGAADLAPDQVQVAAALDAGARLRAQQLPPRPAPLHHTNMQVNARGWIIRHAAATECCMRSWPARYVNACRRAPAGSRTRQHQQHSRHSGQMRGQHARRRAALAAYDRGAGVAPGRAHSPGCGAPAGSAQR